MRLIDESAAVREAFPAEYTDVAAAVTELGDPSVLMLVLAVLFWIRSAERRETALVISYAFAGVAFLVTLETILNVPRPPEELFRIPQEPDDYGFPSGHAFAAAVVYGGLCSTFGFARGEREGRSRGRTTLAVVGSALLIALVSLSRVVLGVHYLGDVIVGAALGIAFVLAMDRATDGSPKRGFAIGVLLSIPAVAVSAGAANALLGLGGAIGGGLGSSRLPALPALRSRLEAAVLTAVGGGVVAALTAIEAAVAAFAPAVVVLYAAIVCWLFLVPAIVGRLEIGILEGSARPSR
ncbi:phosphatase PAP2 family protein [Halomontanus rarus]|uniref:phosphatase PAP2 family protein n=1 Tax=Halomontanus rarus TaxID=3034020 RepID=UPI0023E8BAA9|nr:phosphatase PAP2 family protein [Halovivax sp. TS33]